MGFVGFGFPGAADIREKTLACAALLVDEVGSAVAVDADGGSVYKDRGFVFGLIKGGDEGAGGVNATVEDFFLLFVCPAAGGYVFTGEIDECVKLLEVIRGDLGVWGLRAAFASDGGDFVSLGCEVFGEFFADQSGGACDCDFHVDTPAVYKIYRWCESAVNNRDAVFSLIRGLGVWIFGGLRIS